MEIDINLKNKDLRLKYVEQYKAESIKVSSILAELAARKGGVSRKNPIRRLREQSCI